MPSIPQQLSEQNTRIETLGPHFFSRVSEKEWVEDERDIRDAAPRLKFSIELSATGLGMNNIFSPVLKVCADLDALGRFDVNNTENEQPKEIGSATISMVEMHFQKPEDNFRICTIEQLDIDTGDNLIDTQAFATMLRRIQRLCMEIRAEHLGIKGNESHSWSSGLLKQAGFNLCECELLYKNVKAEFQLCMDLPALSNHSPASKEEDYRMDSSAIADTTSDAKAAESTQTATSIADAGDRGPKKKYCSHWILNGVCAYMQVGCRYKHEIPLDKETRTLIVGGAKIPAWFRESPGWSSWLQQVKPEEREELCGRGRHEDVSMAQPSGRRSDRSGSHVSSRGGRATSTTTTRNPATLGPYAVEPPHENHDQTSIAPEMATETSRAEPSSVTKIESTEAVKTTAGRRPDREIYRRSRGPMLASGSLKMRGPMEERSEGKDGNFQEQAKGRGQGRGRHRRPASGTH